MANQNVRVQIPRNASDLLTLAERVFEKHQADAAASPLNTLQDANWTDNGAKIAQAQALDEKAKQMQKDLEGLFAQRDLLVQPLLATVKASRDLLLGIYTSNPKKLETGVLQWMILPKQRKTTVQNRLNVPLLFLACNCCLWMAVVFCFWGE